MVVLASTLRCRALTAQGLVQSFGGHKKLGLGFRGLGFRGLVYDNPSII